MSKYIKAFIVSIFLGLVLSGGIKSVVTPYKVDTKVSNVNGLNVDCIVDGDVYSFKQVEDWNFFKGEDITVTIKGGKILEALSLELY